MTLISDNACVMSLQSRALLLTNHNHPALISQLLRHQEIAHNASSIHGCVVVENKDSKLGFQEPFNEWVCLKGIITTVGSVRFVYVQTRLKTAEELIYIVFGISRSWSNKAQLASLPELHSCHLQGTMPLLKENNRSYALCNKTLEMEDTIHCNCYKILMLHI